MVSSGRAEAVDIGRNILQQRGNAVDAAVAIAFALSVCEPAASGIGGGGFMLIREGKTGKGTFIDFREKAPAAATSDMFALIKPGSSKSVADEKIHGGKAVAVPGDVVGLLYALTHSWYLTQ